MPSERCQSLAAFVSADCLESLCQLESTMQQQTPCRLVSNRDDKCLCCSAFVPLFVRWCALFWSHLSSSLLRPNEVQCVFAFCYEHLQRWRPPPPWRQSSPMQQVGHTSLNFNTVPTSTCSTSVNACQHMHIGSMACAQLI